MHRHPLVAASLNDKARPKSFTLASGAPGAMNPRYWNRPDGSNHPIIPTIHGNLGTGDFGEER